MLAPFLQALFTKEYPSSFFLIAGPCVVESEEIVMEVGTTVHQICTNLGIPYVFKASYKKANRTSSTSFTGIGDIEALSLVRKVGATLHIPTTSDIHSPEEAMLSASYIDILQIPAFLCRQTDLLVAAAKTQKIVNIKKGQFVSGESMKFAVDKVKKEKNTKVMLTERGSFFGYQDLVVDYRNIPIMRSHNVPVIMDCTHSLQQPNQASGVTGGNPELIEIIAKAAIATGVDGIFIETHPRPQFAKSDGANMLPLHQLKLLLEKLVVLYKATHSC